MTREAVLSRFQLFLNDNRSILMRNVRVVRQERHIVDLVGNPFTIVLTRDQHRTIRAYSNDLGIYAIVPELPRWMIRLLS